MTEKEGWLILATRFHAVASESSIQLCSTVARTRLWYSFRFSRYRFAASAFAGLVLQMKWWNGSEAGCQLCTHHVLISGPRCHENAGLKHEMKQEERGEPHLFGFGSCSSDCILVRIAATSYVGDHRFWRMSRQSSPFAYTFG